MSKYTRLPEGMAGYARQKKWTPEMDNRLRLNAGRYPAWQLAELMGVSEGALQTRAKKMRLSLDAGGKHLRPTPRKKRVRQSDANIERMLALSSRCA